MQVIINKKGTSLNIKNGRFWIRNAEMEQFLAVNQVKSICLHAATKLSYEVIAQAVEHQIDILFIDHKGFPMARIWSNKFGSISTIRKNQITFGNSPDAINWIRALLIKKAENSQIVIKTTTVFNDALIESAEDACRKIEKFIEKFKTFTILESKETYMTFRGWEGMISRIFFGYCAAVLPPAYTFVGRSQHPARDMFNSMLNYAYGMLYSYVESALIKAGIDPYLGIMHRDEYNRPVLTYDVIEAYRYWGDYVVLHLFFQNIISKDFFEINNGAYWLNLQGKRILVVSMNDYLNEIISIDNLARTRLTHIELEAQRLATKIKAFQ